MNLASEDTPCRRWCCSRSQLIEGSIRDRRVKLGPRTRNGGNFPVIRNWQCSAACHRGPSLMENWSRLQGGCANFSALLQRHLRNPRDDLHLREPSVYYVV